MGVTGGRLDLTVSGKGQRRDALPLPREVGEALVAYLRDDRPRCPTRRVFVRIHAPHVGFAGPVAITNVVHRALARAGIDPPFKGSHLLRHSLATAMLHHGASLEEIGQILRHAAPQTTRIYAKTDLAGATCARAVVARGCVMSELALLLDEYLATRRALGNRLELPGRLLKRFVAFAVQHETAFITTECTLQWATEPRDAQPAQWASRLGMVRGFARYAHAVDPRHEVPASGAAPRAISPPPALSVPRHRDRRAHRRGARALQHHRTQAPDLRHDAGVVVGHRNAGERGAEPRP